MADREESESETERKSEGEGSPPTTRETKCLVESSAVCLADE